MKDVAEQNKTADYVEQKLEMSPKSYRRRDPNYREPSENAFGEVPFGLEAPFQGVEKKRKRPKKPPAKPVDAHGMTAIEAFKLGLKEAQDKREWEEDQAQRKAEKEGKSKPDFKRQGSGAFGDKGFQ